MSREVRRVPPGWKHPRKELSSLDSFERFQMASFKHLNGEPPYIPLLGNSKKEDPEEDEEGEGVEVVGRMPEWTPEEATHYQMYEITTEGTPISPVCATPEELARWLTDNKISAFSDMTATYEMWLATIQKGFSIGAMRVKDSQGVERWASGVEANTWK